MNNHNLQQFYKIYYKELYLYLCSLSHNSHLAEDLLQETFLKAMLSLPEHHTNVRAWLYMVARNLFFNYCKREKKELSTEEVEAQPEQKEELLENIIKDEEKRILYYALKELSPVKREILELQFFGNFNQKEIAAMLHLSQENVRVLGYRGKKELKKIMEVKGCEV